MRHGDKVFISVVNMWCEGDYIGGLYKAKKAGT